MNIGKMICFKRLALATLVGSSFSVTSIASACPYLAGRYRCILGSSTSIQTIEQKNVGDNIQYTISVDDEDAGVKELITDNSWRPLPPEVNTMIKDGEMRSNCLEDSQVLKVEMHGKTLIGNSPMETNQWLSLNSDLSLRNVTNSKTGPIPTPKLDITCDRLSP